MEILNMDQGTPEWFAARCGLVTSSKFDAVLAKGRGNAPSKTRETYMKELACERITGIVQNSFQSEWMERGNLLEGQARSMFELNYNLDVEQVGFIKLNEDVGSSTDGLTEAAVIEIKCPKHTTHLDYLMNSDLLYQTYKNQVQGELWVSGKQAAFLMSFHPDFPDGKDLIVLEIQRDEAYINEISEAVSAFVQELKTMVKEVNA